MKAKNETIANGRVGKPDVKPTVPSHVKGVREGNEKGSLEKMHGFRRKNGKLTATAQRSTGISPHDHEAIDPRMPKISPA